MRIEKGLEIVNVCYQVSECIGFCDQIYEKKNFKNDWKLGSQFTDKTVLTMYQVTGNKGWKGRKLWIPNIKLPHGTMYYDVLEDDTQGEQ